MSIPIEGVFFTFDDTAITGYDRGVWCGEYDATSGMTKLDDDSYRFLLKLQILANVWDGTPEKFYDGVRSIFNGTLSVVIEDHQDMTISIGTRCRYVLKSVIRNYLNVRRFAVCDFVKTYRDI